MYFTPWKVYKIIRIILGRKRMRRLILSIIVIAALGAVCINQNPTAKQEVSSIYNQQKEEIEQKALDAAKQKLNTTVKEFTPSKR